MIPNLQNYSSLQRFALVRRRARKWNLNAVAHTPTAVIILRIKG